jgi:hypothetical protein
MSWQSSEHRKKRTHHEREGRQLEAGLIEDRGCGTLKMAK